ncbi:MAG: hypothetical protein J5903_03725, partial [Clostridia bacterium]|nr:hypothetical protein [Clostridia bacterium]
MEEKKEDILKNLKIINSLGDEISDLLAKAKAAKTVVVGINKKINAKEKGLKAAEEARLRAEEEALRLAEEEALKKAEEEALAKFAEEDKAIEAEPAT